MEWSRDQLEGQNKTWFSLVNLSKRSLLINLIMRIDVLVFQTYENYVNSVALICHLVYTWIKYE